MCVNNLPNVAIQWNSGATRDSNRGRRVLIPSALTTRPLSHTSTNNYETQTWLLCYINHSMTHSHEQNRQTYATYAKQNFTTIFVLLNALHSRWQIRFLSTNDKCVQKFTSLPAKDRFSLKRLISKFVLHFKTSILHNETPHSWPTNPSTTYQAIVYHMLTVTLQC